VRLEFHPAALRELIDAATYYDQQRAGLGHKFDLAAEAGFETILNSPNRWPQVATGVRRYRLRRFPYGICYRVLDDSVIVIAVMHLRRNPGYWLDRL
jgi:toxin ParE1/3/4